MYVYEWATVNGQRTATCYYNTRTFIPCVVLFATHMKKAVMLFKGSKGAQFLFTAKYQNN
jgi:hypothetical protein